jgi:hypothetical protein
MFARLFPMSIVISSFWGWSFSFSTALAPRTFFRTRCLTLSLLSENRAVSTPEKKADKRISTRRIVILVCVMMASSIFEYGRYRFPVNPLQPSFPSEIDQHQGGNAQHNQPEGLGIKPVPFQFGHVFEVHSVDAGHKSEGDEDGGYYG